MNSSSPPNLPARQLSLWDATSIIVGTVVGAGIFESSARVAANASGTGALLLLWALGGLIAFFGAMCYAELTTTFPLEGGDYVFLSRAFGPRLGFVFSWAQLWVIRPGSTGAMAFVFARYANQLLPLGPPAVALVVYAAGSIGILTVLNVAGVKQGKWTQNLLTAAKVLGLAAIVLLAFLPSAEMLEARPDATANANLGLAFIFIMFTYGGWNDVSYVAAEVRRPEKNLLKALLLGTASVALIYLAVNVAFLRVLGLAGLQGSAAPAADVVLRYLGAWGARAVSALVCISCLGAINGMILTGARIFYATGVDHPILARVGVWNAGLGTPVRSLVLQGAVTLATVLAIGTMAGEDGFGRLVIFTAPLFWLFVTLSVLALFVLRRKASDRIRPYRVHGYPVVPGIFIVACLFMIYSSLDYAASNLSPEAAWTAVVLVSGFALGGRAGSKR